MSSMRQRLFERLESLQLASLDANAVRSGETFEQIELRTAQLTGTSVHDVTFEQALLAKSDLRNTQWSGIELIETAFDNCNLANAKWKRCQCNDVLIERSQLTGFAAVESELRQTILFRCKLDLSVLHDLRIIDCRFENCDLREADFQGATLSRVVFRNCDLRNARFPAASLREVDLRGSHLAGLDIGIDALRGTQVEPSQVVDIANLFGLVVEELKHEA